jgi:folate-binding Fe-S cluster repair protein YgfZ
MEAEIAADADSRWKLGVITEHAKAEQVATSRLESGHILVRLRKAKAPAGPEVEP